MYDGRPSEPTKAPPVVLDDDVFLAARIAMNDTLDSELLAGVIIDRHDDSAIFSIEAKRRLNNHWSIELESRWFLNVNKNTALLSYKKDSFLSLSFSHYF